MDQMVLFLLFAAAMTMGWFKWRRAAIAVFLFAIALTVADYLHHATDALPLSF